MDEQVTDELISPKAKIEISLYWKKDEAIFAEVVIDNYADISEAFTKIEAEYASLLEEAERLKNENN